MENTNNSALTVARSYFMAMAAKDVDGLMQLVSDDVKCLSPLGDLSGAGSFRGFEEGFARMIERLTLIAAFGDNERAVIIYVADTKPVSDAYIAEHLTVRNGKITEARVIYDSAPFAQYAASVQPH